MPSGGQGICSFFPLPIYHHCHYSVSSVQSLSRVQLSATPWIAARQAFLSITNSRSLLRLMSIESVMPPSHLILCRPLLLLPQIPPSITITHLQKKAVKKTNPYLIVTPPNYIKYSCLWNHKSNEIWKKAKQIFQTATNLTHFKDSNLNLFPRFILFDLMKHWKHHASYKPDTKELILCESTYMK